MDENWTLSNNLADFWSLSRHAATGLGLSVQDNYILTNKCMGYIINNFLTGPYIGRGPVKGNRVNTRVRQGLVLDDPEVNKFDSGRSKFLGLGMSTSKDVLTCPCIVT